MKTCNSLVHFLETQKKEAFNSSLAPLKSVLISVPCEIKVYCATDKKEPCE